MNIIEELRSLDVDDIGRWPVVFRGAVIAIVFAVVVIGGTYKFVWLDKKPLLDRAQQEETGLKNSFIAKQRKAVNFDAYKEQLDEIERSFGAMLRQLPGKTEVPSLLVDISQTGLGSGLEEELFQPGDELHRDFYAELPIKIRLTGSFHQIGDFVSGIAALPRIVTLHDIQIEPQSPDAIDQLILDVTAKTYRYLEEESEGA